MVEQVVEENHQAVEEEEEQERTVGNYGI